MPGSRKHTVGFAACALVALWVSLAPGAAVAAPEGEKFDYGTRASVAWEAGFTGQGQSIAIIDTGVVAAHPWLRGQVVAEACFSPPADYAGGATPICPGAEPGSVGPGAKYGPGAAMPPSNVPRAQHGTSVAGIAAGAFVFGDGALGNRGIAPDADIVAVNAASLVVADKEDPVKFSEMGLAMSLGWVNAHLEEYNVAAVNLSLSGDGIVTNRHCATGDLTKAQQEVRKQIDKIVANGVPVVASAGNVRVAGTKDVIDISRGSRQSLGFPGCLPNVITVGAVDPLTKSVAAVSKVSSAITVMAPGMRIWMPFAASYNPNAKGMGTGTSMAAPIVSAAIALYREQYPTATVAQIRHALQTTGRAVRLRRGVFKRSLNVADLLGLETGESPGAVNQKCLSIKLLKVDGNRRRGVVQLTCSPLKDQSGLLVVSVHRPDAAPLESGPDTTPYGPTGFFKTTSPTFGPGPFTATKGAYKVCYQLFTNDNLEWPAENGDVCKPFAV